MDTSNNILNLKNLTSKDYAFTSTGKIWSYLSSRFLKPHTLTTGYKQVEFYGSKYLVHRVIAEAFIPNPNNLPVVMHLDNDPANNDVKNLKWGTQGDNLKHAYSCGRKSHFGEDHPSNKLVESQVIRIKEFIAGGYSNKFIAEEYPVGRSTIQDIRKGRTWKEVKL